MNRRQFLKSTVGVIGFPYIISSSVSGKNGAIAPSNRIVMGCIGTGGQGTSNMHAFLQMRDVHIAAVCDVETESNFYLGDKTFGREPARRAVNKHYSKESSAGDYKGCASYKDFRELLEREDIDAVTVCTPDHWHGLISAAAAKSGKDIYCEKPLTNTIAEGRAVCEAVKRYGRILQTGSHERSNDSTRFACELVLSQRIGKLHTIRINMPNNDPHHSKIANTRQMPAVMTVPDGFDYDMWLGCTPLSPYTRDRCHFWWRFIMDYGGGEMTDRGAHIIDLAQLGTGNDNSGPVEIVANGVRPKEGLYDTFIDYKFECKYQNGVRMIGGTDEPRGIRFEGDKGWVFINIHGGRLETEPKSLKEELIGADEIHLGRSPGHHRNFIESVKTRTTPVASAETGHRTATICHLLNISMITGKRIVWDSTRENITSDAEANRLICRPMRSPWQL
jgi:predicted dehydrogenase